MANNQPRPHQAEARLTIGRGSVEARVEISSVGLLAIGALVSSILLSTAVLVGVAMRHRRTN